MHFKDSVDSQILHCIIVRLSTAIGSMGTTAATTGLYLHTSPEFLDCEFRSVHRQRAQGYEPRGVLGHRVREVIVDELTEVQSVLWFSLRGEGDWIRK